MTSQLPPRGRAYKRAPPLAEHHSSLSSYAINMRLILLVGALVAVASAAPRPDSPPVYGAPPPTYKQPGMPFEFAYAVQDDYSGNNYAHQETSDGQVTSGSYRVALPDGRTEIVEFTADHDNGYVANVAYEGEASYPAPAPSYPAPAPSYPAPPPPPTYA